MAGRIRDAFREGQDECSKSVQAANSSADGFMGAAMVSARPNAGVVRANAASLARASSSVRCVATKVPESSTKKAIEFEGAERD